jgi:hypothetical protein
VDFFLAFEEISFRAMSFHLTEPERFRSVPDRCWPPRVPKTSCCCTDCPAANSNPLTPNRWRGKEH